MEAKVLLCFLIVRPKIHSESIFNINARVRGDSYISNQRVFSIFDELATFLIGVASMNKPLPGFLNLLSITD